MEVIFILVKYKEDNYLKFLGFIDIIKRNKSFFIISCISKSQNDVSYYYFSDPFSTFDDANNQIDDITKKMALLFDNIEISWEYGGKYELER